jgi:hypothetical protein
VPQRGQTTQRPRHRKGTAGPWSARGIVASPSFISEAAPGAKARASWRQRVSRMSAGTDAAGAVAAEGAALCGVARRVGGG